MAGTAVRGRLTWQAATMANVVTFLPSPATSWVTGAIWDVHGGVLTGRD